MWERVTSFFTRLSGEGEMSREDVLWGALLVGLLFASVHLITMLVTRWGDHKATSKSLIFSVLVHLSLIAGLLIVDPPDLLAKRDEPPPPEPFVARNVTLEGLEELDADREGNTPIWKRLPEPVKPELTRQDRLPVQLDPLPELERNRDEPPRPEVKAPTLASRPEQPLITPQPASMARRGRLEPAKVPLRVNDPTAERRPEISGPSMLRHRELIPRPATREPRVARASERGGIERIDPALDLARLMSQNDPSEDALPLLKRGPEEERVHLRRGPAPTKSTEETAGVALARPAPPASGATPDSARLSRIPTRPLTGAADGGPDALRPERMPLTPRPATERRLASREGFRVPVPREGPAPNIVRPNEAAPRLRKTTGLPETYRLRSLQKRKEAARKYGGTDASEKAVEAALAWLARHQQPEGYWDADAWGAGLVRFDENGVDRQNAGKEADTGVTALTVLAFLGAAHTQFDGPYAEVVDKALRWLVAQQDREGYLGGAATHYAKMYSHAMATYAIAEAEIFHQAEDPTLPSDLREPLERAVAYILRVQNRDDGGWRYRPYFTGQKSDMSIFGWMLMALKSAENAGVEVPDSSKQSMIRFLRERSLGTAGGLAGYRPDLPATASMTAEALFCKQIFRIPRDHPSVQEAVAYLLERLPRRSDYDLYYWYYGTLAMSMYQREGQEWDRWNGALRDLLVADQRQSGPDAGSWDPRSRWGRYGGRVYSTALAALCLEVYYRYSSLNPVDERIEE